jgi:hypothetical protein
MTLCPADHGENDDGSPRQRQAADGAYLCQSHADRLADAPQSLARLYADLEPRLASSEAPDGQPRGKGGTPNRIPNSQIVEARADILAVLRSWSALVSEDRGVTPPHDSAAECAAFLHRHAGWLAAQPFADEALELDAVWRRHRGKVAPSMARMFEVGPCPDCAGMLTVHLRGDGNAASVIYCSDDPEHAWPRERWLHLGLTIEAARVSA